MQPLSCYLHYVAHDTTLRVGPRQWPLCNDFCGRCEQVHPSALAAARLRHRSPTPPRRKTFRPERPRSEPPSGRHVWISEYKEQYRWPMLIAAKVKQYKAPSQASLKFCRRLYRLAAYLLAFLKASDTQWAAPFAKVLARRPVYRRMSSSRAKTLPCCMHVLFEGPAKVLASNLAVES